MLFPDTDSFNYEIESEENVYEGFFKWKDLFDFSNYTKDSKFVDETNKKVIGRIKDEFGGVIVTEFVGIKLKIYSMKKTDRKESNTVKGVSITTELDKFKGTLFNEKVIRHKMKRIQGKKHKLRTYEIEKISLSCFEDKRYVLDDGIRMFACFHKNSATYGGPEVQLFSTYHNYFLHTTTTFYEPQHFSTTWRLLSTNHNFFLQYRNFFL